MNRGRIPWPGGTSVKQHFSLPSSIIYYMVMNPSTPEVYNKMIECCKYFFEKNPILVSKYLRNETHICSMGLSDCLKDYGTCCVKVDINKLTCKLWLTETIHILENKTPNFTSLLCSKLFRCDAYYMEISEPVIMFRDFKSLVSNMRSIYMWKNSLIYDDGSPVMLEKVFESLPNIRKLLFEFGADSSSMISSSTLKNITKLKNLDHLESLCLQCIPEILNMEDLSISMKNLKNTKIWLDFRGNLSEQYKTQLDDLIDTVIESQIPNRCVVYDDQDDDKFETIFSLYVDSEPDTDDDDSDDGETDENQMDVDD